jgi:hypothetical protein
MLCVEGKLADGNCFAHVLLVGRSAQRCDPSKLGKSIYGLLGGARVCGREPLRLLSFQQTRGACESPERPVVTTVESRLVRHIGEHTDTGYRVGDRMQKRRDPMRYLHTSGSVPHRQVRQSPIQVLPAFGYHRCC